MRAHGYRSFVHRRATGMWHLVNDVIPQIHKEELKFPALIRIDIDYKGAKVTIWGCADVVTTELILPLEPLHWNFSEEELRELQKWLLEEERLLRTSSATCEVVWHKNRKEVDAA